MSQRDILDFLKKNKKKYWYAHEICLFCASTPANTMRYLTKLREYNEVEYKEIPQEKRVGNSHYMYKYSEISEVI